MRISRSTVAWLISSFLSMSVLESRSIKTLIGGQICQHRLIIWHVVVDIFHAVWPILGWFEVVQSKSSSAEKWRWRTTLVQLERKKCLLYRLESQWNFSDCFSMYSSVQYRLLQWIVWKKWSPLRSRLRRRNSPVPAINSKSFAYCENMTSIGWLRTGETSMIWPCAVPCDSSIAVSELHFCMNRQGIAIKFRKNRRVSPRWEA